MRMTLLFIVPIILSTCIQLCFFSIQMGRRICFAENFLCLFELVFVGSLSLVCTHVATGVRNFFSACFALPFARRIKALLVGPSEFGGVCESVHCCNFGNFLTADRRMDKTRCEKTRTLLGELRKKEVLSTHSHT